MGSTGSKACTGRVSSLPSSSSGERKGKRRRNRLFQSSCLGGSSGSRNDDHNVCEHVSKEGNVAESGEVKVECYGKVKVEEPERNCVISNVVLDEWNHASITNTVSRTGSSSARALSTSASTSQSSFLSRFNFLPGNMSFRLSRTASLGSSRAYGIPSCSPQILNDEEVHLQPRSSNNTFGNETQQASDLLTTAQTQNHESTSASLPHHYRESDSLDNNLHNNAFTFGHSGDGNGSSIKVEVDGTSHSPRMNSNSDGFGTRICDRRNGAQETVEHNVCFSRTLSVGRLRDRVLRRASVSDATFCPLQQETQVIETLEGSGTETLTSEMRMSESEHLGLLSPTTSGYDPGTSNSTLRFHNREVETTRSRDTRYHELLEHRSNFVERRRRIRSQVRALQRLGSRFENLSGHERSCMLSGHHRAGRCTCRLTNRDANLNDDTGDTASISRIVMLAEALFEVLDEIHQQSVVLSSQPSISVLGSVPAPNDVVESLPVKLYTKSPKHQNEEAAQCYICLVEYEEGDSMRVLPCHHEFHRTCIDKWLKEIHRVCPLCRGDICRSGTLAADN